MSDCWMYPPPFHEASGRGGEAVSTAEGGVSGAIYNGAVCSMGLVEEFCDEPCGEDGCEYVGDFLETSLVLPPSAASSSSSSLITVSAGGRTMPMLLAGPTDCLAVRALSLSLRRTGYTTAQPLREIVRNRSTHENLGSTRVAYVGHIIEECQGRVKIGQCRRSECHRGTLRSDRTQDDLPHNQRIECTKRF